MSSLWPGDSDTRIQANPKAVEHKEGAADTHTHTTCGVVAGCGPIIPSSMFVLHSAMCPEVLTLQPGHRLALTLEVLEKDRDVQTHVLYIE